MPSIGLIVEGEYDVAAVGTLIRRCRPGIKVVSRQCRGTVKGRFVGIVAELRRSRLEKILVVCDADGDDPEDTVSSYKTSLPNLPGAPVVFLVIKEMLEAWLIADPDALLKVVGVRKLFKNPEKLSDPKTELQRAIGRNMRYTPAIAERIAEVLDVETLRKRCPRFELFRRALRKS